MCKVPCQTLFSMFDSLALVKAQERGDEASSLARVDLQARGMVSSASKQTQLYGCGLTPHRW